MRAEWPASRIPPALPRGPRHTAAMGEVVYMVRTKSKASCQAELDRICRLLGATPATSPTDAAGTGWVARAVPAPAKAPAEEGRGSVVR